MSELDVFEEEEVEDIKENISNSTVEQSTEMEDLNEIPESHDETTPQSDEVDESKKLRLIIRLQAVARKFKARLEIPDMLEGKYEKIYDPKQKRCFYYNRETNTSTWRKPRILGNNDMKKIHSLYTEDEAVIMLQCWYRTYQSKKRVRKTYKRTVKIMKDAIGTGMFQNPKSKQNFWELPHFMGGRLDHNYSSDSEDEREIQRRKKRNRKKKEKKNKATNVEGAIDSDSESTARSSVSGSNSSSVTNESRSMNSDDDDDDYDSLDSSVASSVARDRRRLKRTYPRSKAQLLVDICEDREDKIATLTLNLSGIGAQRFTSRIYDLTHLKELILSNNNLTRLNRDIKFLDSLEVLDLRFNQLSKVPIELEELTLLRVLLLGHNRLTTYPGNLYKLEKMENFDISHNSFDSVIVEIGNMTLLKDTHEWEVGIGLFKFLQELNVSSNNITAWPDQVEKVVALKMLDLAHNQLVDVPQLIERNFNLLYLDLSHNGIESIPVEVYKLRYLETLKLSHNKLSFLPPLPPPQVIEDEDQDEASTAIQDKSTTKVPVEVRFHFLVSLNLSHNKFETLDGAFLAFPKVVTFDMSHNELHTIDPCIGKMSKMKDLDLSDNKLSKLPKAFALCMSLSSLSLKSNSIIEIPECIQNLIQLRYLNLSHNLILSQSIKPTFFATLGKMVELCLDHNRLNSLPSSFYSLSKLTKCDASHNNIEVIDDAIKDMVSLVELDLSYNKISSTFPDEITALQNLTTLHLENNEISQLPSSMSQMKKLQHIHLQNNVFTEYCPVMQSMTHINGWNLNNNKVYGLYAKYLDSIEQISESDDENTFDDAVSSEDISIEKTSNSLSKAWFKLESILVRKQKEAQSFSSTISNAPSTDLMSTGSVNIGSVDDLRTVQTDLTDEKSLLNPPTNESLEDKSGGAKEDHVAFAEIDMLLYRLWSQRLNETLQNLNEIVSEPSTIPGKPGREVASSGAAQVMRSFSQDSEYKKSIDRMLNHCAKVRRGRRRVPFSSQLFTEEVLQYIRLGGEYIYPCKKFELICQDIAMLCERRDLLKHEQRKLTAKESDSCGDIREDAFLSGQYEGEASGEAESKATDEIVNEKVKKAAALKAMREEGVEVIDDEFLRIDKLITESKERIKRKRLELGSQTSQSKLGEYTNPHEMHPANRPATATTRNSINNHNNREKISSSEDGNTKIKWKMPEILFDPFLGDPQEDSSLYLSAFECYYGYGLCLLERGEAIGDDIRRIESLYFKSSLSGVDQDKREYKDEHRLGYTSLLGVAQRRGDDMFDMLHDYSKEPYFPRRKTRHDDDSTAESLVSKKSKYVFEMDDKNEVEEKNAVENVGDSAEDYIYYLRKDSILEILDELYAERSNICIYSSIVLAAACGLLKSLGWDTISAQAVEDQKDTVVMAAFDLRSKAAGCFFAFGRSLQALEMYSLAITQFDKVLRICHSFPPASINKIRSYCAMGSFFQAKPILTSMVQEILGIGPSDQVDIRLLLKKSREVGFLFLYLESHLSSLASSGYGNCFQRRVHTLTESGVLIRPERSFNETRHGSNPDIDREEEEERRHLMSFAEKSNRSLVRKSVRAKIEAAVRTARGEIANLESYMEEVGPITLK